MGELVSDRPVVVTGAGGFIGAALVRRCVARGRPVVALSRRRPPPAGAHVRSLQLDFEVPGWQRRLEAIRGAAGIIHLASRTAVDEALDRAAAAVAANVGSTIELLAAARRWAIPCFVHASSIAVYGPTRSLDPLPETAPLNPRSVYAGTKVLAERVCAAAAGAGLRALSFRLAPVYGPHCPHRTLLPLYIERARAGLDLEVWGRGVKAQDFVYIDDVLDALLAALAAPTAQGIYNIGSGRPTGVIELAERVLARFGAGRGRVVRRPDLPGDETQLCLDIGRARRDFGYDPRPIDEGLAALAAASSP